MTSTKMPNPRDRFAEGIPARFAVALAIAAVFVAFITVDQSHWWRLKPDYAFGWLVPGFVVFLVVDRWKILGESLHAKGPSPLPRWVRAVASSAAASALGLGLVVFMFGAIYRADEGASQPGSFALAAGFAGVLLGMVYFNCPEGAVGGPARTGWRAWRSDARIRTAGLFLYPALIWMLSAPLVSAVENTVSL